MGFPGSKRLVPVVILAFSIGCSTPPMIQTGDEPLPLIKKHKHITIHPWQSGLMNTGIHLDKGDLFSIFPDKSWKLYYLTIKTNDTYLYRDLFSKAPEFGVLFVGCLGSRSGRPSIGVDIVVWEKEDWDAILNFFQGYYDKNPENQEEIETILSRVRLERDIHQVETETTQKIKKTKAEIDKLQEAGLTKTKEAEKQTAGKAKIPVGEPPDVVRDGQPRVEVLQSKLAKLEKTLVELDKMKRELTEERKKTQRLTSELRKMEQREDALRDLLKESSNYPPVVVIASPKNGGTVETGTIGLRGVVEDDQGISRIEIFVNNRPLDGGTELNRGLLVAGEGPKKRQTFQKRVRLKEGRNRIRVLAVDARGLETEKALTLRYIREEPDIWALVVGINDYAHLRSLNYAVNDARAFYGHLAEHLGTPEENLVLLLNEEASLTRLRSVLGTHLKNRAGKDDMVIIYFAGHGATEPDVMSPDGDGLEKYLLPHDAELDDLYASALPMREIRHIFNRIRSERLVFILDSCYSGASGGRTVSISGIRANISSAFMDRIASSKGRVLLCASGANEVSKEDEDLGHGVFTYYLLEGLQGAADKGGDGLISVDEVYSYVSRHVPEATGQEQHPIKKGAIEGPLILGIHR